MIEGYYGVTGEQYVVKDDDFLALGHHKLRFYLTPMVHWPETMMTFDETEGVLFSGDGFGCFGTLDGGFLDTRINTERYWDEMVRYYSNIVGKYGSPVQKALQKLGGLHITTICSTHGPVWTEYISKVIGIYDKLSRYAADEGVVIAYGYDRGCRGKFQSRAFRWRKIWLPCPGCGGPAHHVQEKPFAGLWPRGEASYHAGILCIKLRLL